MSAANILIIEDDADIREGVRILLEGEDYAVTEAADGAAGLKLVAEDTDLVILDVMMPGISGLKTCEELRKFSYVPVLFLTAKAQESDKLIGLMARRRRLSGQALLLFRAAGPGQGSAAPLPVLPRKAGRQKGDQKPLLGILRDSNQPGLQ